MNCIDEITSEELRSHADTFFRLISDHGRFNVAQLHEYVSLRLRVKLLDSHKSELNGYALNEKKGKLDKTNDRIIQLPVKRRLGLPNRKRDRKTIDMFQGEKKETHRGPKLRWYQEEAIASIQSSLLANRSTLCVLPTGTGKTVLFSSICKSWDGRVLVLAHRDELISQARETLQKATGEFVGTEKAEYRAGNERLVVASIQTIHRRLDLFGKDHFALIIVDECFPAGTMVDGAGPIELIEPGDYVTAVDHASGEVVRKKVTRVFEKTSQSELVLIRCGATEIVCTPNHPVFVKGKGYVIASAIGTKDMLCLWGELRAPTKATQEDLFQPVQQKELCGDFGANEQAVRVRKNEEKQPNASGGQPGEDEGDTGVDRPQAEGTWRERSRRDQGGAGSLGCAWESVGASPRGCGWYGKGQRLPNSLQARPCQAGHQGDNRGGRVEPFVSGEEDAGQEEGGFLVWTRVDNVSRVEQTSPGGTRVYNLEVEGAHTYFANGILVHNCHRSVSPSYLKVFDYFCSAKVLGVTATPDRSDEKAMGQVFDDVAYVMDIEDGIDSGYLVPVRGKEVFVEEVDLSNVSTSAGDLAQGELDQEMLKATESVVRKTYELAGSEQVIIFTPGVASAHAMCDRMNEMAPGKAIAIDGQTEPEKRKRLVAGFKGGQYQYLFNCAVATEGFDAPATSIVAIARPTKSRSLYAQMVGRSTRVLPGTVDHIEGKHSAGERRAAIAASKKTHATILDFVGNSGRHSLVGPVDVLGGSYTEEEVKLAKKKVKEGEESPRQALQDARQELRRTAIAMAAAKVKARITEFDPFKTIGMRRDSEEYLSQRFGSQPMTEGQRNALKKFGMGERELGVMDKRSASKALNRLVDRAKKGLASLWQIEKLSKHMKVPDDVSFQSAMAACEYIKRNPRPDMTRLQLLLSVKNVEPKDLF